MIDVVDVTDRIRDAALLPILAALTERGDPQEIDRILARYETGAARLYALVVDGEPVATAGVDGTELRTVATRPDRQRRGHASHLIDALQQHLGVAEVHAETDDDAVDFYRAIGFEVQRLGERHHGVVRYRCTRRTA